MLIESVFSAPAFAEKLKVFTISLNFNNGTIPTNLPYGSLSTHASYSGFEAARFLQQTENCYVKRPIISTTIQLYRAHQAVCKLTQNSQKSHNKSKVHFESGLLSSIQLCQITYSSTRAASCAGAGTGAGTGARVGAEAGARAGAERGGAGYE